MGNPLITNILFVLIFIFSNSAFSKVEKLRVFSWEGYVTKKDVSKVNILLKKNNINYEVEVIDTLAAGPEQMFNVIRQGKCDVAFLTLFFIKMKKNKITQLLQEININSKRFTNYNSLIPASKNLKMGLKNGKPLYIPFGGGIYGFWANMNKVKKQELPKSISDLWLPRWKKKISLNKSQIWYNIGITLMSMGKDPFFINDLIINKKRDEAVSLLNNQEEIQNKLSSLYKQSDNFWSGGTKFKPNLEIVSSWGPEMKKRNEQTKENWKLIKFKEGNIVWMDTLNFVKGVKGEKLKAAEVFANYFIGKDVQSRLVKKLSMYSVSNLVKNDPIVAKNKNLFNSNMFVPPYSEIADNVMQILSKRAFDQIIK